MLLNPLFTFMCEDFADDRMERCSAESAMFLLRAAIRLSPVSLPLAQATYK